MDRKLKTTLAALLLLTTAQAWAYTQAQFDSVTSDEERQVNQVRDQEISQLKIVLGRRFAESRRPDILLRLAELYVEKYRYYSFKENEIHQKLYREGIKEKYVDHKRSRVELDAATNACLSILKSRVNFGKLDEVYYFLGYNAEEAGRHKDAVRYFEVVVKRFPNSTYAPEAFRNLAENAFNEKQYARSVSYYEHAARFTKLPSYPRTLYKLAWSYFKMRRKSDALTTMKKAIEVSAGSEKFVGLREEALNDIVVFFSEAGRHKEAHDYFQKISGGPEIYARALGKLAGVYEKRGEYRTALAVNNSLIEEYGDKHPGLIYDALGRNVELFRKVGDGAGEEAGLTRLVKYFADHSGDISKGDDGEATYLRTKNYLRGRATEVHKAAQKKKDAALYSRAADLYSLYIKAFLAKPENSKDERELSEIRTYRSDALLAAGRDGEALPELERALRDGGDSKHRREAGATLMNILIKRLDAARAKGKDAGETEKRFLDAAEEFESAFPDDKLVAELKYKRARLAASKSGPEGLSKDARRALGELIEKFPSRPESVDAAHDLVADAVKRKDMDDATRLAQTYLANTALLGADKKKDLTKYLSSVLTHQSFQNVQEVEKDKDFKKAAVEYESLAAKAGGDVEVASKSLNNAAVNYERAGELDAAVRVYLSMLAKYPNKTAPENELKRIASQYLWRSQFVESARLYGRLAGLANYTPEERLSFIRTAFTLSWGTGDLAGGFVIGSGGLRELCEKSGFRSGAAPLFDERCHELAISLGQLLVEAGKSQEASSHLRHYLGLKSADARRAEAAFMLADMMSKARDTRKATIYYEEAAQAVSRSGKGGKKARASGGSVRERNFAAHAAFLLVEPHFARFSGLKLELPEQRLKTLTRQKLDQLEGLVTRYLDVVSYGDGEWGIAALERLYDAFSAFSAELEHAPVPSRLAPEKIELYRRGLRQVSEPMAARAFDYLKQGYQKGLQLEVTTSTFVALTQRLARRAPREYPPAHYAMAGRADGQSALRLTGTVKESDASELLRPDHAWRREIGAKLAQNPKNPEVWLEFGNLEAMAGRLKLARLLYEQAVALNPKGGAALGNLSIVAFLEQRTIEATQGLRRAAESADSAGATKDSKLNLVKAQLAFHHFAAAIENLRRLAAAFPDDREIAEALAAALLGSGQVSQAASKLEQLDAKSSKHFNLWYNWSVWALLAGGKDQRESALGRLKTSREGLAALEKSQVDLVLAILGDTNGANHNKNAAEAPRK